MKKKIVSVLLLLCMAAAAFTLSGCGMTSLLGESEYEYDAEKIQTNIKRLTESGYKITMRYLSVSNESGREPEIQSSGFSIAADRDLWYCEQLEENSKTTVIMDFSDDESFVTYTKDGDGEKWEKTVTSYEHIGSKDTVKSLYMDTYIATFTSYGVLGLGLQEKGSGKVAGRQCTKYEASVSVFGASYSNEYWIDNETGLCLKNVVAVGSAAEGNASASYECTAFEVGYRITLPSESECVTEEQLDNNTDNSGDNDTEDPTDLDFGSIMSGNGATDTVWGKQDEATKQYIIAAGKESGMDISFGIDGSMTVYDPTTGETTVQKPDGTWVFKDADGNESQLGGSWPDNEYTKLLPKPDLDVTATTSDDYSFTGTFVTEDSAWAKAYAEKVKTAGFDLEIETEDMDYMGMVVYMYSAKNAAGYTVEVAFSVGMTIVTVIKP